MKLLENEWVKMRNKVIPKDAPQVQLIEMRRAFFAGAWAFYSLLMNSLEPGLDETPKDMALMAQLDAELREFRDRVEKGHA